MEIRLTIVVSDEEGGEVVTTYIEIVSYGITSSVCEVDDPELASLPSYGEFHSLEVYISTIERREF